MNVNPRLNTRRSAWTLLALSGIIFLIGKAYMLLNACADPSDLICRQHNSMTGAILFPAATILLLAGAHALSANAEPKAPRTKIEVATGFLIALAVVIGLCLMAFVVVYMNLIGI